MTDEETKTTDIEAVVDELPPESVAEVKEKVAEYERDLRSQYRRASDRRLIEKRSRSFFRWLIDRELADEARDEVDLRQEEHVVINWNLGLSLVIVLVFAVVSIIFSDDIHGISLAVQDFVIAHFSWFYILVSATALIFLVYLALSRFGAVVLGDPDEEPEFSDVSWYAMLFSAGMGVGILFYGAAEPVSHFLNPPAGMAPPGSAEAGRLAMVYSAFHWGFHAWAIYTLCAAGVAYFGFRKRKKYLISSSIVGIVGHEKLRRPLKTIADLVSTLAIVFGVSASLGLGILQVAGGMNYSFGIDLTTPMGYIAILGAITVFFIASAMTGLNKGIKILSNVNMAVALSLMAFVFVVGPRLFILKLFVDSLGQYLSNLFSLSFMVAPLTPEYEIWMGDWTLSYFTWWIAWAPFVGIFIARISRGRTLRELIVGALVVPTVFSILWFSVFGGSALYLEIGGSDGIGALVQEDVTVAFFALLERYPLSQLTSAVAIFLLFTFLVTSADSACFVISMMTTEGDLDPSAAMKVMWGAVLAVITAVLVIGGGLDALRAAALTFAFPFSIVLVLMAFSVTIRLRLQVEQRRI